MNFEALLRQEAQHNDKRERDHDRPRHDAAVAFSGRALMPWLAFCDGCGWQSNPQPTRDNAVDLAALHDEDHS